MNNQPINPQPKCVVITCFDAHQPGYLDFAYRIAALAKVYQLIVVSQHALNQPEFQSIAAQHHVISHRGGKLGWFTYLIKCARLARKHKPAVLVLLHSATAPITLLTSHIPTCVYWNEHPSNLMQVSAQQLAFKNGLTKWLHKLIFLGAQRASVVMPIGEAHADDLLHHGVAPNNISLCYMGVADQFLINNPVQINSNVIRLVYTGTVSEARGRDVMLQAMKRVADAQLPVHLCIVGASEAELLYCQQAIQTMHLQGFVEVVGRVAGNEIPHYLAQADAAICLWQASPWTLFNPPTKLFEYLVAGLPVLASNIRTHTRYISHGENGLIFDYNAESLAQAITHLCHRIAQLPAMKVQARHTGEPYLWRTLESVFLNTIRKVHA